MPESIRIRRWIRSLVRSFWRGRSGVRVLFLTDDFLPHRGGSRVYYHEVLTRLAKRSRIEVVTRRRAGDREFDRTVPYRVRRVWLGAWGLLRFARLQHLPIYLRFLWAAAWGVVRRRPDFIIAGELVPTGPVAALVSLVFRVPMVVFTHAEGPSTLARTRLQSRLAQWVCERAWLVVAASENARGGLVDDLEVGAGKIEVIPPGVADRHLDDAVAATPFEHEGGPRLLSVGRLVRRKGFLHVMEALPDVIEKHPGLSYTIVGTGPREDTLREAIERLGLCNTVRVLGEVDDKALMELYRSSDCFVLPNHDDPTTGDTEGFVIVFGEASAHGLPVVAGRDGGTMHSVLDGRTGVRIDGSDPVAVRDALLAMLGNPEHAKEMGRRGREFAATHLRWDDRVQVLETLLHELLDN